MSDVPVPEPPKSRFEQYRATPDTKFQELFPQITLAVEEALSAQQAESKVTTPLGDELRHVVGPGFRS